MVLTEQAEYFLVEMFFRLEAVLLSPSRDTRCYEIAELLCNQAMNLGLQFPGHFS
jgi:hypothetical protein